MKDKPMTKTCMCWGLEVNDSWLEPINKLCQRLEALNYEYYPKFHVRIQADQIKSKYAYLTFYYSVVCDPSRIIVAYEKLIDKIVNLLSKIDFKCKYKIIKPARDSIEKKILTEEDCKKETKYGIARNVKLVLNNDGTVTKEISIHYSEVGHYVPLRFKLIHKILSYKHKIRSFFRNLLKWQPSHKQLCIGELLDSLASNYIKIAEDECEHTCEECGNQIGSDWSPKCTTFGWISYICKECADKHGENYEMNGEIWNSGKRIMTKEEHQKQLNDRIKRFNNENDDEDDEE